MTPEQIGLLESSLDRLRPQLAAVAEDFYVRLFAAHPDVRDLFTGEAAAQHEKFAAELELVCRAIRRHDGFLEAAGALGVRHDAYGVRASHYRRTGPILLDALAAALGPSWTPELEGAWRHAYGLTVEAFLAAGRRARRGA